MPWARLSVRDGSEPDEPYEGAAPHLRKPLAKWIREGIDPHGTNEILGLLAPEVEEIALLARVDASDLKALATTAEIYPEHCLNIVDAALHVGPSQLNIAALQRLLALGGSVYTVAPDGKSLTRRVEETAAASAGRAIAVGDAASQELSEAWTRCYGRRPDPSDAWDHAIKAVEEVLRPLALPKNPRATLGLIRQHIFDTQAKWTLPLTPPSSPTRSAAGQVLVDLIDQIWPNPDRHGGGNRRIPTQREAEAVVQVAVLLVQWARSGHLAHTP